MILLAAFALLGAAGAQAAECSRFAVQVATQPVPYQYPHGLEKADRAFATVPEKADTILLGDSLVEFWPKDMAAAQFSPGRVWNIGIGGARTQEALWMLGKLDATKLAPKRIFVLVGTNNLTFDYMPACAIAAGIKAVVAAAHDKWPGAKVDVMGIPPRGLDFRFRDTDRLTVNAALKAWSRRLAYMRYFEVDANEMTCGQYSKRVEIADAGADAMSHTRCSNYADDFGHFLRPGYDIIYSAMPKS